jgi:hypothetical protein
MIANSNFADLATNETDPMAAMQGNALMMMELMQEVSRVAGSEISRGPVPAGSSADSIGRVSRGLRRSGSGLNPTSAKSPQAMMRIGNNVNQAMSIAMRTGRPNMRRIIQMTAQKAHQVVAATNDLEYEQRLRLEQEQRLATKKRMAMLAGASAAATNDDVTDKLRNTNFGGLFGSKGQQSHVLGHMLAHSVFPKSVMSLGLSGQIAKVTKPMSGIVDRIMGKSSPEMSMGMDAPSFEMALEAPKPEAPTLTAPKPSSPVMRM